VRATALTARSPAGKALIKARDAVLGTHTLRSCGRRCGRWRRRCIGRVRAHQRVVEQVAMATQHTGPGRATGSVPQRVQAGRALLIPAYPRLAKMIRFDLIIVDLCRHRDYAEAQAVSAC
jgi:hypothetical protein